MGRKKKEPTTFDISQEGGEAVAETNQLDGAAPQIEPRADGFGEQPAPPPKDFETITMRLRAGRIDVDGMRDTTKQKLLAALTSTPEFAGSIGPPKPLEMPDWAIAVLYNLIGWAESYALKRTGKYDPELVAKIFQYDQSDIAILKQPTEAVLQKWIPDTLKYKEEGALVLALLHVHMRKVALLNATLQMKPGVPDARTSQTM